MSAQWREDSIDLYGVGGAIGPRSKPRFSFTEVKLLLEAVKRNRYIILKKFNQGVSAEAKKQTWAEITEQINDLGENHREVRQIMKKWADLKCDGKRRIAAMRGPHSDNLRKKHLGPVEKMVHKILMMSPGADGDSDLEFAEEDAEFTKLCSRQSQEVVAPPPYSYLSMAENSLPLPGGASFDFSPLSSPEKDLSDGTMDFDDNDDSMFSSQSSFAPPSSHPSDPLPDDTLLRTRPVHTYSRNNHHSQNHTTSRPPARPASSAFPLVSDVNATSSSSSVLPHQSEESRRSNAAASSLSAPSSTVFAATDSASQATQPFSSSVPPLPAPHTPPACATAASSSSDTTPAASGPSPSLPPPPHPKPSSATSQRPLAFSSSAHPADRPPTLSDPLPAGASSRRDHVAQMAAQSLQQQRASRMLLSSVSQSLEILAQSVQLLVESQQEFVQESLLLQRETVGVLKDFSNTALAMLREKSNSGQAAVQRPPSHF
ncbi:uncharacterized protein LOC142994988 [Genypterus blacodes]|uniref:uncharacterized protein LOC142994988 n=1 Tax=Genypterus blacodes TaxID=154954 RepID=UPI003F773D44